nr:M48 family metalloprotease [Planosporangium thailandense]
MWALAGLGVLLVVAAVLYLLAPWWTRRRGRLIPVTREDFPDLYAELTALVATAGLRRTPIFVIDAAAGTPGGLAFGRLGRYTVRLNAGLVPVLSTEPATFRAVVLHELAHIRNRDVDLAYAAVALWRAFIAVAMVPLVVVLLDPPILTDPWAAPWSWPGYGSGLLVDGGRTVAFAAVVYLSRNAVLRSRELYADARAAAHAAGALRRILSKAAGEARWRARIAAHPLRLVRLRAIDDPLLVVRPCFAELFGAGLTTAIAADALTSYAYLALPHTGDPADRVSSWLVAPVATGLLAAAAWRAAVASAPHHRLSVVPAALGFGLGWLCGDLLATPLGPFVWGVFGSAVSTGWLPYADVPRVGGFSLDAAVAGSLLLAAGMLCQAGLVSAAARCWLPVLRGHTARRGWLASTLVTAVPFAVWYGIWSEVRSAPYLVGRLYHLGAADAARLGISVWEGPGFAALTTFYPPLSIFLGRPLAVPVVMVAWLYPLAAWLRRPAGASARPVLRLRWALTAGVIGGAAVAAVLVTARALLHRFAPDLAGSAAFSSYYYWSATAVAVLAQAVVGGVVAAPVRPLGLVLGQFAAFCTAVVSTAAMIGVICLGGCIPTFRLRSAACPWQFDTGYVLNLLRRIVVEGAIAALLAGVAVSVVAYAVAGRPLVRWRRARSRPVIALAAVLLELVLVATLVAGPVGGLRPAQVSAQPSTSASRPPSPSPGPVSGSDPCVIGTWVEVSHREEAHPQPYGAVTLVGTGTIRRFGADGTLMVDYGDGVALSGTARGDTLEAVFSGTERFEFHTEVGTIVYTNPRSDAVFTWKVNGLALYRGPAGVNPPTDRYTCTGNTLRLVSDNYVIELRRS